MYFFNSADLAGLYIRLYCARTALWLKPWRFMGSPWQIAGYNTNRSIPPGFDAFAHHQTALPTKISFAPRRADFLLGFARQGFGVKGLDANADGASSRRYSSSTMFGVKCR